MAYDSERAMFEAYSRNKYSSTGVIQWMLNNAWPSLIWHLWDYYLQPAGGYYGVKKACEPLHVMYSYDDRSVAVVNSMYQPGLNLSVTAKLFDSQPARTILRHRARRRPRGRRHKSRGVPGARVHSARRRSILWIWCSKTLSAKC